MWFVDKQKGSSAEYNIIEALRLRGRLDCDALTRTVNTIVERHESLRTRFDEIDGQAVQVVEPLLRLDIPVHDLTSLEADECERQVQKAIQRETEEAFDLHQGPVIRLKLLKLTGQEHVLLRSMHHIVSDGWSQGVFNREFTVLYEAYTKNQPNPLQPLVVQYSDFAMWQRSWLEAGALQRGLDYWKRQLAGSPERLELPCDRPRPPVQSFHGGVCEFRLSSSELGDLARLSRDAGATLYMVLVAAFAVLLSRYSQQEDIVIGSPIANRQAEQLDDLIGLFVNLLVMCIVVHRDVRFSDLLKQVRATALDAYEHQDVPFDRIVQEIAPQRRVDRNPLFQVTFAVQNAPWDSQLLRDLVVELIDRDDVLVRFDMELHAFQRAGELSIFCVYRKDLFDRWRIEQMMSHFGKILRAVAAKPDSIVRRIELLDVKERERILKLPAAQPNL